MTTTTNIISKWYATDNTEGSDFTKLQTISVTTAPEYPGAQAMLGDIASGNNGSQWIFVQASTTVTTNNLVAIDCNFAANNLTASLAASLKYNVGIAQFSATLANPGDYFWAMLRSVGGAVVNNVTAGASGVALYVSSQQAGAVVSTIAATSTATAAGATNALLKNINSTLTGATATVDITIQYGIVTSI
jgi:Zn-dependent M16 (insulinase) family peptidase